ncbi:MAG: hypothetical protein ACTSQY_10115, partial [Candidatus Odinarchaeia archaeon]
MNANSLYEELKNLFKEEKYWEIIERLKKVDSTDELDYRHYRFLAVSYLNVFEYEKALEAFKLCIDNYPKIEERDYLIVEPLYLFAHKLLKNRQYDDFRKVRELLLTFNNDYYFFRNLERKKISFQSWDKKGYFAHAITLLTYIMAGEKFLRSDIER